MLKIFKKNSDHNKVDFPLKNTLVRSLLMRLGLYERKRSKKLVEFIPLRGLGLMHYEVAFYRV